MHSILNGKFRNKMYAISSAFLNAIRKISVETNLVSAVEENYDTGDNNVSNIEEAVMPISKEQVDQIIASDTVVIFSKTRCPYCKLAKQVFDTLQKKYTAIELDERDDGDDIQTILGEITGARTVPRVFVKGVCLGGGTDVKKLYDNGELQKKF